MEEKCRGKRKGEGNEAKRERKKKASLTNTNTNTHDRAFLKTPMALNSIFCADVPSRNYSLTPENLQSV